MTEKRLIVIEPDSTVTVRPLDGPPGLQELTKAVGGWLETVPYFTAFAGDPCVAFCDEDGKRKRLPVNEVATFLWKVSVGRNVLDDVLVGPVVIITGPHSFLNKL
jgi:Domain of unknown function (DUF3846)